MSNIKMIDSSKLEDELIKVISYEEFKLKFNKAF